jgi:hypothetical protein
MSLFDLFRYDGKRVVVGDFEARSRKSDDHGSTRW